MEPMDDLTSFIIIFPTSLLKNIALMPNAVTSFQRNQEKVKDE
jgi:hypothetical protein